MKVFNEIGGVKVSKSYFPRHEEYKSAFDGGQIIPTYCKLVNPGDVYKIKDTAVARLSNPLKSPIMHQVDLHTSYFFVPLRLLFGDMVTKDNDTYWDHDDRAFEMFITGGRLGTDTSVTLPRWYAKTGTSVTNDNGESVAENGIGSLWDYLGFPTGVQFANNSVYAPVDFPRRAYNLVYAEYFMDETLGTYPNIATSNKVFNCCWRKDFFTSMLPWPQRGLASGVPLSLSVAPTGWTFTHSLTASGSLTSEGNDIHVGDVDADYQFKCQSDSEVMSGDSLVVDSIPVSGTIGASGSGSATGVMMVNDLRVAVQVQKVLERTARSGFRYKEYLLANYATAPTDERLQRPEYIGGYTNPLIVSEVATTSNTDSGTTGALAGKALVAGANGSVSYHAKEFGILLGVTYIRPRADYQQGVDPEWLVASRFDFVNPAFSHLSEQPVRQVSIYAQDTDGDDDTTGNARILGYQAVYNEYRSSHNRVTGLLRTTLNYWHMGRIFNSAPVLNESFLKCVPDKRCFSTTTLPSYIVTIGHNVDTWQNIPIDGTPGLVDHN